MAEKTRMMIDRDIRIGKVDDRIYGSFIEHLGRAVYTGIYEPGHPEADEEGFRKDVLELVKDLGVTLCRYPGGNFVSNYRWEDGVGPVEERKKRLDLAWRTLEPNTFGTSEFAHWAKKAGCEIMMAVNLGTRGIADALNLLEYTNLNTPTEYAEKRAATGDEPYDVKLWCMGNEMDGPWQLGHKEAKEYGRLAAETARAMKQMDPSIECVACGSSNIQMPTFARWEATVLEQAYEDVDYISMHQYWGNQAKDTADFFAVVDDCDRFIRSVVACCDYVQALKRSKKQINLSFDEWNVWVHTMREDHDQMDNRPWTEHPHLLEDIYTFEDAIVDGLALITFLRHADRVKVACLAQLVNVIAPIMTEENGRAWRQTIYWPFAQASKYGRGYSLQPLLTTGTHATSGHGEVTDVVAAAVYCEEKEEVTVFAVNRNIDEAVDFTLELRSFDGYEILGFEALESDDMEAVNTADEEKVHPTEKTAYSVDGNVFTASLAPASWNVIRFGKKA